MQDAADVVFSYMVDDLTSGFGSREQTRAALLKDLSVPLDPDEADRVRRSTWGADDPLNADLLFADDLPELVLA